MDATSPSRAFALVGPGRAGTAVALALAARGWRPVAVAGRTPDASSTRGVAARLAAPAVVVIGCLMATYIAGYAWSASIQDTARDVD